MWSTFWPALLQLLGTVFAVGAATTGITAQDRTADDGRLVAGVLGLVELAVGSFAVLSALAPEMWLAVALALLPAVAGGAAVAAHRRLLQRLRVRASLSPFNAEQLRYSWISWVAYFLVVATCWIPESVGWLYALRAAGPCWLAISGSWEVVAYAARFKTLFHP